MVSKIESKSKEIIDQALVNVLEAGFGEVIIKVADHVIVNIDYRAQRGIKKQDRKE